MMDYQILLFIYKNRTEKIIIILLLHNYYINDIFKLKKNTQFDIHLFLFIIKAFFLTTTITLLKF